MFMKFLLLALAALLLAGCIGGAEVKVEKGDSIAVDYLGYTDDGKVFDTSIKAEAQKAGLPSRPSYEPLEFTAGAGQMIKGFDDAVIGMKEGEEKTINIPAAQAYGERNNNMIVEIPRNQIPGDVRVGAQLQASNGAVATVVKVTNDTITIDGNHPLAGKALNFKITVRKITKG